MTSKVFCVEEVKHDIRGAQEFGDIIYLFDAAERRPSIFTPEYGEEVLRRLVENGFDKHQDLILLAGNVIVLVTTVAKLAGQFGYCNVLAFDSQIRSYVKLHTGRIFEYGNAKTGS
jgi:hypothetical protein